MAKLGLELGESMTSTLEAIAADCYDGSIEREQNVENHDQPIEQYSLPTFVGSVEDCKIMKRDFRLVVLRRIPVLSSGTLGSGQQRAADSAPPVDLDSMSIVVVAAASNWPQMEASERQATKGYFCICFPSICLSVFFGRSRIILKKMRHPFSCNAMQTLFCHQLHCIVMIIIVDWNPNYCWTNISWVPHDSADSTTQGPASKII